MGFLAIFGSLYLAWAIYVIVFSWQGELKALLITLGLGAAVIAWLTIGAFSDARDERYDQAGAMGVAILVMFVWPLYLIPAVLSPIIHSFGKRSRERAENENLIGKE